MNNKLSNTVKVNAKHYIEELVIIWFALDTKQIN